MKLQYICLVILLSLCSLACEDYSSSNTHPIEHTHDYDDGHNHEGHNHPEEAPNFDDDKLADIENRYSSESRRDWQKPYLAISMFGDLEDKTIADIGAGPEGYFTFYFAGGTNIKKIIAIDIDQKSLDFINASKKGLGEDGERRIETRLAQPNDAKLKDNEVDDVLISETLTYIDNPVAYLNKLKKSIKQGGKLLIIDFKMKKIPSIFPSVNDRIPLYKMEKIVEDAGFKHIQSDDTSLPFHYMVLCENL